MTKQQLGKAGEDFCAAYFENCGYSIVCRNYHSRYGEIDIVAESEEMIAFVEVKTRNEGTLIAAREAVDFSKRRKIMLTALKYISEKAIEKQVRFDVFEAYGNDNAICKFNHIENAFDFDESVIDRFSF